MRPIKIGFLEFHSDLFEQLLSIAAEQQVTEEQLKHIILATTQYMNGFLQLPLISTHFEINVLDYKIFRELYESIHEDLPIEEIPLFSVVGAVNLKDFDAPGYIVFSLPKQFVENQGTFYTFKEFLINAAHERFARFLVLETIIAKVYEKAREDYHQNYTLDKEKNVSAFMLYTLNKDLIALQETITYAIRHLVENFIDTNFEICDQIHLPLIEESFEIEDINATEQFKKNLFERAQVNQEGIEMAYKRLEAGLNVLRLITRKFDILCADFLEIYPKVKSTSNPSDYDLTSGIGTTIQLVLQKHQLTDLMALFDQELAHL